VKQKPSKAGSFALMYCLYVIYSKLEGIANTGIAKKLQLIVDAHQ
jgi:hypothetical protein